MCSQKSRIPVFSFQEPRAISVPEERQPLVPSKKYLNKAVDLEPHRDRAFAFGAKAPECFAFKGAAQGLTKSMKDVPPPTKKPTIRNPVTQVGSRLKRATELRTKNKILEAAKGEMMMKLEKMQNTVKELKEQCENLQKENHELKQFQKCCMQVLETRNCHSDAGNRIFEEDEKMKEKQADMMVVTEKLNADLELFCKMAKEQKDNLQTAKMKWKHVEEERARFLEKQQCFQREIEVFAAILDQEDEFVTAETPVLTLL